MYTQSKGRNVAITSYRSLLPKKKEWGTCWHVSQFLPLISLFGSIRMEPVFMLLGQSVAMAAVQTLEMGNDLHYLDYQNLRDQLLIDGQKLDTDKNPPLPFDEEHPK